MSKYFESRLSMRLGLVLFACMFIAALGYAQNASAVVRVSAGVNIHGGGGGGYDLLAEYGEWMRVPAYGVVWCPYVDESWAPFYDGRWIRTRRGWAWDSYEPFGDIVYHYGYWYRDFDIGWFWVPGNEWSPARVQWYTYGNYCGWARMPPPHYYWPDPWDSRGFNIWVVVNINNFGDDHVGRHGIDRPRYREVFRRGDVARRAPAFQRVETASRRRMPVRTITERPMDIRTDRIKIAERSATRRDVRTREIAASRQRTQPQREAAASKRTAPVERKAEVGTSNRTAQGERKTEAPAKNARSTKSRAAEKRSDRDTDRKAKR